ncbi:MAG: hypothetical protein HKN33_00005, partial [Pyrinomonadaceae bacterium]|nr:hypothetical protein [Pyrinomonadaceae bacterium]
SGGALGKIIMLDSPPHRAPKLAQRLTNYARMVANPNWETLKPRLRFLLGLEDKITEPGITETQKTFFHAYKNYVWAPIDVDISLVIAKDSKRGPWMGNLENEWKSVTSGEVEVNYIEGEHATIFEQPYVTGLGNAVQVFLDDLERDE